MARRQPVADVELTALGVVKQGGIEPALISLDPVRIGILAVFGCGCGDRNIAQEQPDDSG